MNDTAVVAAEAAPTAPYFVYVIRAIGQEATSQGECPTRRDRYSNICSQRAPVMAFLEPAMPGKRLPTLSHFAIQRDHEGFQLSAHLNAPYGDGCNSNVGIFRDSANSQQLRCRVIAQMGQALHPNKVRNLP